MVAYLLWRSWKIVSHFTESEQVKNFVVILLLIVWHGYFLDILLNPFTSVKTYLSKSFLVYAHISFFWGGEGALLKYIFWESNCTHVLNVFFYYYYFLFIPYGGCSFSFKKILVTDQFNIRLQFWLNLGLGRVFVKSKERKIQSNFIFLIFYLHCWYTHTTITILYFLS